MPAGRSPPRLAAFRKVEIRWPKQCAGRASSWWRPVRATMLAMAAALDHRTSALQLTNAPARSLLSVQRPLITVPLLALLPLVLAILRHVGS